MKEWLSESGKYVLRRLLSIGLVLLGVATITFVVTRLLGNPVYLLVGQQADQEIIDNMIHQMGLDRPLPEQYLRYLGAVAHGDLGISRVTQRPVLVEIGFRLPATLELVLAAMGLVIFVGIPVGILSAVRQNGVVDRIGQFVAQVGISVPSFWMGLILIYVFFFRLHWSPPPLGRLASTIPPPARVTGLLTVDSILTGNWPALVSAASHLVLPAIALALVSAPSTYQITRNTLIQVLRSDYIRTAKAYGFPARMIYVRYSLRNTIVPIVTMLAMTFGFLMSSTVLVETVFAWPGLGLFAVDSMHNLDYEPILGVVLLSAFFYALAYFVADVVTLAIDPRIRAH
ncbi:MAG: ABC transporter permease [Caldilineaceae bacterium]|nr:ABC transporter permease [Caldilineaceae bacterium]